MPATTAEKTAYLEKAGYDVKIEHRKPYRGAPHLKDIIWATKASITYAVSEAHTKQLQSIQSIQDKLPSAARIVELLALDGSASLGIVQLASGKLVWELGGADRPKLDAVLQASMDFVRELRAAKLVHADLRPWNVFYDGKESFRFIDWGFAFFMQGQRYGATTQHLNERGHRDRPEREIDAEDVCRMSRALRDPSQVEKLWHHPPNTYTSRPAPWI